MRLLIEETEEHYIVLNLMLASYWLHAKQRYKKYGFLYAPPHYKSEEWKKLMELFNITI